MGAAVFGVYHITYKVTGINSVCTILSIVAGIIVYAVALLLIKGLTEQELESFPKGTFIIKIAKKLHLL